MGCCGCCGCCWGCATVAARHMEPVVVLLATALAEEGGGALCFHRCPTCCACCCFVSEMDSRCIGRYGFWSSSTVLCAVASTLKIVFVGGGAAAAAAVWGALAVGYGLVGVVRTCLTTVGAR